MKIWSQKLIISKVALVTHKHEMIYKSFHFNYMFEKYVVGRKHVMEYFVIFKRIVMCFKVF